MVSNGPGELGSQWAQGKMPEKKREQKPQVDKVCSVLAVPNCTTEPCGKAD